MSRVIVVVRGGVVQDVFAEDADLDVSVLDYDNDNLDETKVEDLEEQIESLHQVY